MGYSQKMSLMMFAVVIMGVLMAEEISAQDCASALVPCAAYLNSTKPPETCCKPLRETIMTQRKCLCDLFADKNLLPSMGINVTQVLLLPKNCGVSSDTSLCSNAPAPAPMSATSPTGATSTPLPAWFGCLYVTLFLT
ncbi:hypothetical protein MKW92_035739 [Papaver armeniacum]|nr:hypothetical protein MKW92_035739 [Papaver armeniacum]